MPRAPHGTSALAGSSLYNGFSLDNMDMRSTLAKLFCVALLAFATPATAHHRHYGTQRLPYGWYFFAGRPDDFALPVRYVHRYSHSRAFFIAEPGYRRRGYECAAMVGNVEVRERYVARMGTICRPDQI